MLPRRLYLYRSLVQFLIVVDFENFVRLGLMNVVGKGVDGGGGDDGDAKTL